MSNRPRTLRILHVDDDGAFAELATASSVGGKVALDVETEPDPRRALARIADGERFDCVVTDHDVSGLDGLSLAESVREKRPDLPVVLFSGTDSGNVVSGAGGSGVADAVRKTGGPEQFARLATCIEDAVDARRVDPRVDPADRRFRKLIEESVDVVAIFDPTGEFEYLSPSAEPVVGYAPGELVGENVFEYLHPADGERVRDQFVPLFEGGEERVSVRCQFRGKDGNWVDLDVRARNLLDDPDVDGLLVYGQDATGRVQRERELERYETMVNESGDLIYTTDDAGYLTAVNDAAATFVGYSREELIGEHVSKIVTEESAARGRRAALELEAADDPDGVTIEQEFVTADGEAVISEAHLRLLYDSNGAALGAVAVVRDISRRKERERSFRALHDATRELVAAGTTDEVLSVFGDTARDVLGLTLVGVWLYEEEADALVPVIYPDDEVLPDDPPTFRRGEGLSWGAFEAGETRIYDDLDVEGGRYNPDTRVRSEIIAPIGDHGVLNSGSTEPGSFDESDRYLVDILAKNAAAALDRVERETELQRLHVATRSMIEAETAGEVAELTAKTAHDVLGHAYPMVRLLSTDGSVLEPVATSESVHHRMEERPSYRVGEGTAGTAFARGTTTVFDRADLDALDDDVDRADADTVLCVPIGWHGVLTIGDLDGDGLDDSTIQLVGILAANAETALDRIDRQRELERQNERLDEFAGVVSHDLRNPLNVALAWIDMLEEDGDGVDLAQVRTPLERMETLIEDVLSLARGGRDVVDPEPIPLADVVEQGWATAGSPAGQLVVDGDLGTIEGDGGRLQQLFENLFRNAREHAGQGVTVHVGPTDSGFYVEDDGPGFPATERDRAFESGYTTTEQGTGFGLAIVERIVEAHGWSIEIVDGRDGGARFEITGVEAA